MILTKKQLVELTGYKRSADHIRWLTKHGWKFEIDRLGRPKVAVEEYMQRMVSNTKKVERVNTPNFAWMKRSA